MDMKNTVILLMFLLAILGLIVGVYYSEADDAGKTPKDSEKTLSEDSNSTITITIEPKEKNKRFIDEFLT